MKHKSWWSVAVTTLPEAEDAVGELLLDQFKQQASTYRHLETGVSTVTVYLPKHPAWPQTRRILNAGLARIKSCGLLIGSGKISLRKVRRENWAESWKRHFQPIQIGDSLLIKPSWSKRRAKKNQSVVVLDPGLSFGTGQHPTTGFCLEQLAAHFLAFRVPGAKPAKRPGERNSQLATQKSKLSFLDLGTGSGILAIAAAKLGYSPVEALDFDPAAVSIARGNARRNRVFAKIHIGRADVTRMPRRSPKKFSLVCANLISNLLISEQPRILATVQREGVLVLAGILEAEFENVRNTYEKSGLKLISACTENEWRSGVFAWKAGLEKKFE